MAGTTFSYDKRALRLGIIVPSSNTALEPLTSAIVAGLSPSVTVHFSRFSVTRISLDASGVSQFDVDGAIMSAARLLADANVDVIGWSGTSAGWLGFDQDETLCRAITKELGIPATTSTLALNKALDLLSARRFALVTPYLDDVQSRILDVYKDAGYDIVAERHLRVAENLRIAEIDEGSLDRQVAEIVAQSKDSVEILSTFCTNLVAAHRAETWEREHGIVVLDTVSTVIWDMLRLKGHPKGSIKGWGKLFDL